MIRSGKMPLVFISSTAAQTWRWSMSTSVELSCDERGPSSRNAARKSPRAEDASVTGDVVPSLESGELKDVMTARRTPRDRRKHPHFVTGTVADRSANRFEHL